MKVILFALLFGLVNSKPAKKQGKVHLYQHSNINDFQKRLYF